MNTVCSAFWGEGISDERFFPILIQRLLEALFRQCGKGEWDIMEPIVLKSASGGFVEQVLDVARQSQGLHILFIHTDADARSAGEKVMPHKIAPALEAIRQLPEGERCNVIIPVIPVTKSENWKLADSDALREVLGTNLDDQVLGLNIGAKQLEARANSKALLDQVIEAVQLQRGARRYRIRPADLDASLAKSIRLGKLYQYDSFKRLVIETKDKLISMNMIETDCEPSF